MPTLDVELRVIGRLREKIDTVQSVKQPMTKDDWIQIHQNDVRKIQKKNNCLELDSIRFYL